MTKGWWPDGEEVESYFCNFRGATERGLDKHKQKIIYVASGEKDRGAELTKFLRDNKINAINPWEHQTEEVFKTDLELVRKSDVVAVIMPIGGYAYGVICEAMYAHLLGLPVFTLTNNLYKESKFMKGVSNDIFWLEEDFREVLVAIND